MVLLRIGTSRCRRGKLEAKARGRRADLVTGRNASATNSSTLKHALSKASTRQLMFSRTIPKACRVRIQ